MRSTEVDTLITHLFTGRPARLIRNHSFEKYLESATKPLTWSLQGIAADDIYSESRKQNLADHYPLLAGQRSRLLERGQNAKDIINEIVSSANTIIPSSVIMNTLPITPIRFKRKLSINCEKLPLPYTLYFLIDYHS